MDTSEILHSQWTVAKAILVQEKVNNVRRLEAVRGIQRNKENRSGKSIKRQNNVEKIAFPVEFILKHFSMEKNRINKGGVIKDGNPFADIV